MSLVQKEGGSGTYLMIGSELASGHHDFYFDFDERVLAPGVELFVRVVLDILG